MTGNKSRSPQALPYGYTLHGQYQIGDVLGQGGFGITYMARDVAANRNLNHIPQIQFHLSGVKRIKTGAVEKSYLTKI